MIPVLDAVGGDRSSDDKQMVLVVDDDARLRDLLCTVLTPLDCEIAQAASGEEALTALLQRRFAVIVLDINMPGMDGFETAQLIRDVEELASTPIIFLTGQAEAGDLDRGYDLGAVDFLVKPVPRQVFYAKVKALLELDRSFSRLRRDAADLHEQQLQVARTAEVRQRDELAVTRRRERLTNIFAEASIDLPSLEKTIVTELSQVFTAECVLRLPTPDHGWHESLSHTESRTTPELLQALMIEPDAAQIEATTPYRAVMVEELAARSQRFGVVCVGRLDGPAFTESEAALFRGAAAAAALAISNAMLYRVQAEYAAVMQATGDAILAVDVSGVIRSRNKAATALFAGEEDTLVGRSIVELAAPRDRQRLQEELDATLGTRQEASLEMTLTAHDGREVEVMTTLSPIGDSVDLLVAVVVHDLTEIKRAQTEIRHLASHDPLTGLANRRQLTERLAQLARAPATGLLALLYLDVNEFKIVNDTFGHDTGDELLLEIAARLRTAVGDNALVCRVGGDEFVVILDDVAAPESAVDAANRILDQVQAQPVYCKHATVQPSLSLGIACIGSDTDSPDELLTQADMAMFEAKKNRVRESVLYTAGIGSRLHGITRRRAAITTAIARSELRMVYQPIVDAETGRLFGLEALLRWNVDGDDVPPAEILSLAEDSGETGALGGWILARSLRDFAALGRSDLAVHVNVSPEQVLDGSFLEHLIAAQRDNGIDPENICLELTERAFNRDPVPAHVALQGAREYGFSVAIDDFGVEHASMTNLMHVPVNWLKIDRSFVAEVCDNERMQRLVRGQLAMARCVQAEVIAEGVETDAQSTWLLDAGCVLHQGFLYSRPIEAADLAGYVGSSVTAGVAGAAES